jgi:hypothetical protein
MKTRWTASNVSNSKYLGPIEFEDSKGEFHSFEVIQVPASINNPARIVFGGTCNVGFLESGHINQVDCETVDETLCEMLADLETYYNDGSEYITRIVCNERM